jgi:serine protease Do
MDQVLYQPVDLAVGEHTLRLATLTDELRSGFRTNKDAAGVLVFAAQPGGWQSDLSAGDLILEVNSQPVNSANELAALVEQAGKDGEQPLLFHRLRAGKRHTVAIKTN